MQTGSDQTDHIEYTADAGESGHVEHLERADDSDRATGAEGAWSPQTVDVRRNAWLATTLGLAAGTLAVGFGLRVVDGGTLLDWVLFGTMVLIAVVHLASLLDSRAPLLVADEQGVRLREGSAWHGIGWRDVECLEHLPRRGLRDGHLLLVAPDEDQLVVPLTLATRVRGARGSTLSDDLASLAGSDADVVEVVPGLEDPGVDESELGESELGESELSESELGDSELGDPELGETEGSGAPEVTGGSEVAGGHAGDVDGEREHPGERTEATTDLPRTDQDPGAHFLDSGTPEPADSGRADHTAPLADRGRRATGVVGSLLHRALPHPAAQHSPTTHPATDGATALDTTALRASLAAVEPLAGPEEDTDVYGVRVVDAPSPATVTSTTQVLGDLQVEPAAVPVVGRELRGARERIRLTIDQLAERTRIRPHVLEAMEVDDFAACGGDFYARGHLRTISRVLGLQSAPLVAAYDEKYADAPVDPKRVFESELATGAGGAIRGARGGRNWSVLVAAVMAAVLVWSVARLVMDSPAPVADTPVLNQSGGITNPAPRAEAVPVTLTAVGGGAKLVVRDQGGDIVFDGRLAFGQSTRLDVAPPVRISSSDGSVTAAVAGDEATPLGDTGEHVTKTLVP